MWQVSLPPYGGRAQWRVDEESALQLDGDACLRVKEDESANTFHTEPFEGPLIGSAMAIYGLCCTAAVAGLVCKKCWQRHRNRPDKAAPPPGSTAAANDPEAAMELQDKSSHNGGQEDEVA